MQRKWLIATVLLAAATAVLFAGPRFLSRAAEQLSDPVPEPGESVPAAPPGSAWLGVGSCASPACHGGADSAENIRQKGKWNSSYTVWVEKDKHAKAYSVLYSDVSKQILRNLDHLDSAINAKPYLDQRCLACHSTVAKGPGEGAGFVADGVGCEACHGAARGWITEHTVRTWDKTSPATHRNTHGPAAEKDGRMVNTRDMAVRASVCVDCHVGAAGPDGLPARNMDHDMIAAGHPRLTFELGAFLANMPHHWDDREEKSQADYSAHAWALGQVATTQAALRLLAARAKAAEAAPATARWPEFSEYDCYTCHHRLSPQMGYRQAMKAGERRKLGRYVWGTWYLPMTRILAAESAAGPAGLKEADRVVALLNDPAPPAGTVSAAADAAARALEPLLVEAKKSHYNRQAVDRLLLATKDHPTKSWDEACGQYLLFRTAYGADPRFAAPLAALRQMLQFRDVPGSDGKSIQYNSPLDFDPVKFNEKMNELRAMLPQ